MYRGTQKVKFLIRMSWRNEKSQEIGRQYTVSASSEAIKFSLNPHESTLKVL